MIQIRNATMSDVETFHKMQEADPEHSHTHILENTIRAWAVEKDGELACIAGIIYGKDYFEAFSDIAPNLVAPKRTIWKYAKILAENIKATKLPVIAFCRENPDSGKFLESLGFRFIGISNNRKIYGV